MLKQQEMDISTGSRMTVIKWICSTVAAIHLIAVISLPLAAPSGPWPIDDEAGGLFATPPKFAENVNNVLQGYLDPIKFQGNYKFLSNSLHQLQNVQYSAVLFDKDGKELQTISFPDESANSIVQQKQMIIGYALAQDQLIVPPEGEFIPAPNQELPKVTVWASEDNGEHLTISIMNEVDVPRDITVQGPSVWQRKIAQSLAVHLGKQHGAHKVEIRRITYSHIPPDVLYWDSAPVEEMFKPIHATFGQFIVMSQ